MSITARPKSIIRFLVMTWCTLMLPMARVAAQSSTTTTHENASLKLTDEEREWLDDHGHMKAAVYPGAIYGCGNLERSWTLVKQALALDRAAFGDDDQLVALSLAELAEIEARRADILAARRAAAEVLAIRRKRHPETHWRVTDARLALEKIERWAVLRPEQHRSLIEAERLFNDLGKRKQNGQASPAEWRTSAEKVVELQRQFFGDKDLDYARGLWQIAAILFSEDRRDPRRIELARKSQEIVRERLGADHPEFAVALHRTSSLSVTRNRFNEAKSPLETVAAIYLTSLGDRDYEYVSNIYQTSVVLRTLGDNTRCRELLEKGMRIVKTTRGVQDTHYAVCLDNLARTYQSQGALAQAEPLFRELFEILRDRRGEYRTLDWYYMKGVLTFSAVRNAPRDVVEPMEAKLGEIEFALRVNRERTTEQARWLTELAREKRGQEAAGLLKEALAIYEEIVGVNSSQYTNTLSRLRTVAGADRAKEATRPRNPAGSLKTNSEVSSRIGQLRTEANVFQAEKAYDRAESSLREALELSRKNWGDKHFETARNIEALAAFYKSRKAYDRAEPLYLEAVEVHKSSGGDRDSFYWSALFAVGQNRMEKGDKAGARDAFRTFLRAIVAGMEGPNGVQVLQSTQRWNIYRQTTYMIGMGMNDEVERALDRVLTLDEQSIEASLFVQSERERLRTLPESLLGAYLPIAMDCRPIPAERIYRHILANKGMATQLSEHRLLRDQPELKSLVEKLNAAHDRLASLAYTVADPGREDDRARKLTTARDERQYVESEFATE